MTSVALIRVLRFALPVALLGSQLDALSAQRLSPPFPTASPILSEPATSFLRRSIVKEGWSCGRHRLIGGVAGGLAGALTGGLLAGTILGLGDWPGDENRSRYGFTMIAVGAAVGATLGAVLIDCPRAKAPNP